MVMVAPRPGVKGHVHPEKGAPREVPTISSMELFAIVYYDEEGRRHISAVVMIGDGELMLAPNGEQWMKDLKPAPAYLKEEVLKRVKAKRVAAAMSAHPTTKVDPTVSGSEK